MIKKFCLLATLLVILIFPAVTKAAANWIWVYSDDYVSLWIDNNSIGRDSNGFFAYLKTTYSDAGRNRLIEGRHSADLSVNGFHNLSQDKSFCYFKNSGNIKYFSILESVYYDKNGTVLDSYSTNNLDWHRIVSDTYIETMYDAVYARVRGKY